MYDKIILTFILVIGSFFRVYMIRDYMTFLGDEGRDVLKVYEILHGNFTLLGPTASVGGFFLGPIYYYFMVPFLWIFNYDPVGPAVMVALFGIATVFLIYKVGKEFFGTDAGLVASGLYAISPLVVTYSRSSWNPNLMPFFSLLTLYTVYKALTRNSIKLFLLCGLLFGITMQLHYLALFLGVIIFVYILLYHFVYTKNNFLKDSFKNYLWFFLGFLIGLSPFLAFELRHGFPNIVSLFNFVFYSGDTGGSVQLIPTISNVFFRIFGRLIANFPEPQKVALGAHTNIALWYYSTFILGFISIWFLLKSFFKEYKLRSLSFTKVSLLAIWFILGVGLFGFYKKPIYDYYFGFMFPLPFLIVGFFLKNLWQKKAGKFLSILILAVLIWLNSLTPPHKVSANRQAQQIEEISKFVIDKAENKPFNFALITGGNSDHAYRYFFTLWQKEPTTIQNVMIDQTRSSVTDQLLVVCEIVPNCYPLGHSLWEIAGFGRAEIIGEWNVSVIRVYKLEHYKVK